MSADSDWAARSTASGVFYANPLNSESDVTGGGSIQNASDSQDCHSIDTGVYTSGSGSLKFTLRAGKSFANIGGAYSITMPQSIGAGDDIYIQYRYRVSSGWYTAKGQWGDPSVKASNMHGVSSTCQSTELTFLIAANNQDWSNWYNNCGDSYPTSATLVNNWNPISIGGGDGLIQQGSVHDHVETTPNSGYNCHYQNKTAGNGNGEGCFAIDEEVWYTVYIHAHLAVHGGSSGNNMNIYIASNDGPYLQVAHVTNFSWPSGGDSQFSRLRLETYMTEISGSSSSDTYCYFDEVIMSTSSIAAPNSAGGGGLELPLAGHHYRMMNQ